METRPFYLKPEDREVFDALRIEASAITPRGLVGVRRFAQEIEQSINTNWGQYIPEELREERAHLADRILVVPKDQQNTFVAAWSGDDENNDRNLGVRLKRGNLVVVNNPHSYWEGFTEEDKQEMARHFGTEARARQLIGIWTLRDILLHEAIHSYARDGLPLWFDETATSHYQRFINRQERRFHIVTEQKEKQADFYEGLLQKHGDIPHKMFFGASVFTHEAESVLSVMTPELAREITPEYYE